MLFGAPGLLAQGLLPNGDFDTDVSGWIGQFNTVVTWDSRDASNDPNSGSALVTGEFKNGSHGQMVSDCLTLGGELEYEISFFAEVDLFSGGPTIGSEIEFFSDSVCTNSISTTSHSRNAPASFALVSYGALRPSGAQSATLTIRYDTTQSGFPAYVDSVNLVPGLPFFDDGFESGDFSGWSGVLQ